MDNFDLKKFLKESKAIENLNPAFKALNENESREERADVDKYEYEKGKKAGKREAMKKKIKEMIIAELGGEGTIKVGSLVTIPKDEMDGKVVAVNGNEITVKTPFGNEKYNIKDVELLRGLNEKTDVDLTDPLFEDELEEAKKKKDEEVEDVEDVEVTDTTEEVPAEDMPADEMPTDIDSGLEDISADMKGTEGELMDHLMSAFKIAKGMNNEKLETQVGNTLKFFVSEYIGGGEG
jgi:hypothetical protein